MQVKRSHIVPKFYLRGFCDAQKDRLWVGDLHSQKTYLSNVRDAGVDAFFYKEETGPHEDNLEERLSKIESEAAPALIEFLRGSSQVTPELGRFIAWLAARTYWLRRKISEELPKFIASNRDALAHEVGSELRPFRFVNGQAESAVEVSLQAALDYSVDPAWRMQVIQDQHLDAIRLQAHLFRSEHFPDLNWVRATAPHGFAFITSDRPVCWDILNAGVGESPAALKHPAVELTMPLNNSVALVACRNRNVRTWTVNEINLQTCLGAERFLYGHSKNLIGSWLQRRSSDLAH